MIARAALSTFGLVASIAAAVGAAAACSSTDSGAGPETPDATADAAATDSAPDDASPDSTVPCTGPLPSINDLGGGGASATCNGACAGVKNNLAIVDFTGAAATFSPAVAADGVIATTTSDFSQTYGTNGRTCFGCHGFDDGWTLSPNGVQQAFQANATAANNDALDPVFRTNDGANAPEADVSTAAARQSAYSMLLNRAVIRVGMAMPTNAQFTLVAVDDPYGHASAADLSLFRRPLPTQNLRFESDIMWDGREDVACGPISLALSNQANNAILSHAAAAQPLAPDVRAAIVDFERTLFAAQISDFNAGALDGDGATGGPVNLAGQPFYIGMNDSAGADPHGVAFNPIVFTLFDAWKTLPSGAPNGAARAAIARGQTLFNTKTFAVTNVRGLNDDLGMASVQATCSTCHDTPNVGNSSLGHRYDIGISDAANRTPDLPLYTFKNTVTGETLQSTDPGRALISGQWKDIGRFKVPSLRNLAARFPYFHNGSATTLTDVIKALDTRFTIGLSDSDTSDLVAFLLAL